jgi:uncharacterized protein YjbK
MSLFAYSSAGESRPADRTKEADMPLEQELKLALSAQDAERLLELLGPPIRTTVQHNYYLDTPEGHLRKEHYGLRLRVECAPQQPGGPISHPPPARGRPPRRLPPGAQLFLLTLKGPSTMAGELVSRTEEEVELERAAAERILRDGLDPGATDLAALAAIAARLGLRRVACLGSVTNERRILRLRPAGRKQPLHLEVDCTAFPDGSVDYEMEFELADPDAAGTLHDVREFIAAAGLPYRVRRCGKFTRFLQRRARPHPEP